MTCHNTAASAILYINIILLYIVYCILYKRCGGPHSSRSVRTACGATKTDQNESKWPRERYRRAARRVIAAARRGPLSRYIIVTIPILIVAVRWNIRLYTVLLRFFVRDIVSEFRPSTPRDARQLNTNKMNNNKKKFAITVSRACRRRRWTSPASRETRRNSHWCPCATTTKNDSPSIVLLFFISVKICT